MVNSDTIALLEYYEGFRSKAYVDPATGGLPITIGYGTTIYPNGTRVKMDDTCTQGQAQIWAINDLNILEKKIQATVHKPLSDNELGALCSFTYNEGFGDFLSSTLLKKININPTDTSIRQEFQKWDEAGGHVMDGLLARRNAEANLYFK
jgi:lysozyme